MKPTKEKKYNYFYKITNKINQNFYYGIHSTNNLNDGYMGSGTLLHRAYKEYGIENFQKEIIKFFDNREDLANYEKEIVTEELILNPNCYNILPGGETGNTLNSISVRDKDGNCFRCSPNDPKYISGEYIPVTVGVVPAIIKETSEKVIVTKEEYHNNKDKYKLNISSFNILVKHKGKDEEYFPISKEEYSKNKDLYETKVSQYVSVEDKDGNRYRVLKTDPRYLSGELIKIKIKKPPLSEEHKQKLRFSKNVGEENGSYGTVWVTKDKQNIRIKKELLNEYIKQGWRKGRDLGGIPSKIYEKMKTHKKYIKYMSSKYKDFKHINFGQCHICGEYNCSDSLCKIISNTNFLHRLIDIFHFDVSKLGTIEAKEEFFRIKNEWQELRNKMSSVKEIAKYYGILEVTLQKIFDRFNIRKQ